MLDALPMTPTDETVHRAAFYMKAIL